MGTRNVDRAFALYGEALRAKPKALLVLVYMARHSVDADHHPFCSIGAVRIAKDVFGRPDGTAADKRAVERVMADLRAVGAITTDRRASPTRSNGYRTARYALHLDRPVSIEDPTVRDGSAAGHTRRSVTQSADGPRRSRPVVDRRPEGDLGVPQEYGVAPSETLTTRGATQNTQTPMTVDAAVRALAAKGIRSSRLRSLNGGKAADSPDDPARQLPLLGLVIGDSQMDTTGELREAR